MKGLVLMIGRKHRLLLGLFVVGSVGAGFTSAGLATSSEPMGAVVLGGVARASQPAPRVFSGTGSRVLTTRLSRVAPLVVSAAHNGSANFVIKIVGNGANELLVNEIGSYSGQVVWDAATAGRYRIAVEADGAWKIVLYQPVPADAKRNLLGSFSGRGSQVIFVKTNRSSQPVLNASHRGQANFVVRLIGYGTTSGTDLLVNEIGNYHGQTLLDQAVPRGTYALAVEADGVWALKFVP